MRYYLLTLGCPKNTVDSEGLASLLAQSGCRGTAVPQEADLLIVNTCGFLAVAAEESLAALRELAALKQPGQVLIAAGCLAQRDGQQIIRAAPEVDGLLGTLRWMEIVPFVDALRRNAGPSAFGRHALLGDPDRPWIDATPRPPVAGGSAYLKISDGCNAPCAFCSIPSFKGRLRSRPQAAIVAEARDLVASGAREIVLIAQDTTDYGRDLGEPDALPELIRALLDGAPDLRWLRLMYAYPGHISDRLIDVMAGDSRVCHYLDIPLQHGYPAVLRRMLRPSNTDRLIETLARMRRAMPDIALRSTFIVGFPGETEEEYRGLLDFVDAIRFDKVGAFTFSREPGTPAYAMTDAIPEDLKQERYERLMARQQRISLERNREQVGRSLEVLVEAHGRTDGTSPIGEGPGAGGRQDVSLARSYREAPEVDGLVVLPGTLPLGEMTRAVITGALAYDLLADVVTS